MSSLAEEKYRLGVFGGTFNPPHMGHVSAALNAAKELGLEKVLLIPTFLPPHKSIAEGLVMPTPEQRLEMVGIAASLSPKLVPDDCEIRRGGKSYTFDTLTSLQARFPSAELWFICGTDMFLTLPQWYRASEMLRRWSFACAPRDEADRGRCESFAEKLKADYGAATAVLVSAAVPCSSTEARVGEIDAELPQGVAEYIKKHGLYRKKY